MSDLKSYFFTEGPIATKEEAADAKKLKFTLINGQYGDTFKRDCEKVAGNYPDHLEEKATTAAKKAKSAKAEMIEEAEASDQEKALNNGLSD